MVIAKSLVALALVAGSVAAEVGNGTVYYTVEPNYGPARTGTITIGDQTFTVTQASGCTWTLSQSTAQLPAAGGAGAFNVTTVTGCTWTAVSSAAWLTVTSNGFVVSYSAAPNTQGPSRTGTIMVGGNVFTVKQSGKNKK